MRIAKRRHALALGAVAALAGTPFLLAAKSGAHIAESRSISMATQFKAVAPTAASTTAGSVAR